MGNHEHEHDPKHECGCGCGHEHDHDHEDCCCEDADMIYLTLDDDTELECQILGVFEVGEQEYIALLPRPGSFCGSLTKSRPCCTTAWRWRA